MSYHGDNAIKSYLYTATRNRSLDYLNGKYYRITENRDVLDIERLKTEAYFLEEVITMETTVILENAINTLPKKCAQIVRLALREFSNAAIAEELSISINTVKVQKRIAYQRLRNHPQLKPFIYHLLIVNK